MLRFEHSIEPSRIPGAGLGLFTREAVARGRMLIVPNQAHPLRSGRGTRGMPKDSIELASSIRWFERVFTVDPEWSGGVAPQPQLRAELPRHLGFVFALEDLDAGSELTIDYRQLLDEETMLDFRDSVTGREIRGLPWEQAVRSSSEQLAALFAGCVEATPSSARRLVSP